MSEVIHFKKGQQLNAMLTLCTNKFDGKFDKAGRPYILHCLTTMGFICDEFPDDEPLQAGMLGHDLVEDTDVTFQYLRMHFDKRVVNIISHMTRMPGQTEQEYLNRIMESYDAIRCKQADLRHNTDIRRLKGLRDKDLQRIEKYHRAWTVLKSARADHERTGMVQPGTIDLLKQLFP